jgi:hypothetical protein
MKTMKKTLLIAAAALFAGTSASLAQDTTRHLGQDTTVQQKNQRQSDGPHRDQSGIRTNGDDDKTQWTHIRNKDVPASLRTTLNDDSQYKGWENTGVYRNKNGDRFRVQIGNMNPETYYFDKDGKPEKKTNQDK